MRLTDWLGVVFIFYFSFNPQHPNASNPLDLAWKKKKKKKQKNNVKRKEKKKKKKRRRIENPSLDLPWKKKDEEDWTKPSVKGKKKKKTTQRERKKKKGRRRRPPRVKGKKKNRIWLLTCCGFLKYVCLSKCHHNSVSITWKHLKCVFICHNSSLKNQKIEW